MSGHHAKRHLFLASSAEGLRVGKAIQLQMEYDADVEVWTDGTMRPTETPGISLKRQLEIVDAGIFVVTPDDITTSRGVESPAPRDNVNYQLGLFAGRLGQDRAIIVHPRENELKFPSDLNGVEKISYSIPADRDARTLSLYELRRCLASACTRVVEYIETMPDRMEHVSWEELCALTRGLAADLRKSPAAGGYKFDIIVGLSSGGVVVADLLARLFNHAPIGTLWSEWDKDCKEFEFAPPDNWVNGHVLQLLQDSRVRRILVVDDIADRGITLRRARDVVQEAVPDKTVRTAALIAKPSSAGMIDFIGKTVERPVHSPFIVLDKD